MFCDSETGDVINTFNALADLMQSTIEFRDCHVNLFSPVSY